MFRLDCRTCIHCEHRPKGKDHLGSLKHISEYYCTEIKMQMLCGTVYNGICRRYSSNKIYNIYVKLLRALVK